MKDYLLILCIAVIGVLVYHDWASWLPMQTPPPAVVSTPPPSSPAGTLPTDPAGVSVLNPAPVTESPTTPAPGAPGGNVDLANRIAESQRRALRAYPSLAVPESHLNTAFNARYRLLKQQNSPRLNDAAWPEQLAAECAGALPQAIADTGEETTFAAPKSSVILSAVEGSSGWRQPSETTSSALALLSTVPPAAEDPSTALRMTELL